MSRTSQSTHRRRVSLAIVIAGTSFVSAVSGCASVGSPLASLGQRSQPELSQQAMMTPAPLPTPVQSLASPGGIAQVSYHEANANAGASNNASACGCAGCESRSYQPQSSWATPPAGSCLTELQGCAPENAYGCETQPTYYNAYGTDPQEFLCDGGDAPPSAVVRRDDSVGGLGLEDTVVHYTTEAGDIEVQPSNRVCVYAPRFASVRKITGAVAGELAIGAAGINKPVGTGGLEFNQPGLVVADSRELGHADISRSPDAMRDRNRGVRIENVLQLEQTTDVLAALAGLKIVELDQLRDNDLALLRQAALAAVTWSLNESVEVEIQDVLPPTLTRDQSVEAFTVYDFPDAGRLRLCKLADRDNALPGEVVTFMLRVDNVGDSAVTDVLVTDNLTTRLEYVEDSQTASGGAEFSTEPNEGQSTRLSWKLTDKLRVGESVTIRFKARVR